MRERIESAREVLKWGKTCVTMSSPESCAAPLHIAVSSAVAASSTSLGDILVALNSSTPQVVTLPLDSPLLPHWTPATISERVKRLQRVYASSTSPRFGPYHDPQRPMARAFHLKPLHDYVELTKAMKASAFLSNTSHWLYYSGEVERDLPAAMLDELRPLEAALIARNPRRASVNLWLGRSPVTAPCHYDGYHNQYAQLHGRKRFILAPPTASRFLEAYPFLHPSHAQCQRALSGLDDAALAAAGGFSVELKRGDLLYLPPMWLHETEAIGDELAISVNGWADGEEGQAAAELFDLQRPAAVLPPTSAEPPKGADAKSIAYAQAEGRRRNLPKYLSLAEGALSLVALLSSRCFDGNETLLASKVWFERYKPLLEGAAAADADRDGSLAEDIEEAVVLECAKVSAAAWEGAPEAIEWADAAARLAKEGFSAATRALWLSNLAETIVAERVGLGRVASVWRGAVCL